MARDRDHRRASRLAEFRDRDAEYRETRSKEAARRREEAREKGTTPEDRLYLREKQVVDLGQERSRIDELMKRFGASPEGIVREQPKSEEKNDV